jgi:hypothetical protein
LFDRDGSPLKSYNVKPAKLFVEQRDEKEGEVPMKSASRKNSRNRVDRIYDSSSAS